MRKRSLIKRMRDGAAYWALRVLLAVAPCIPKTLLYRFCSFLGFSAYYLCAGHRKRTIEHLTSVFGQELCGRRIRSIARGVFVNLGRNCSELLILPKFHREMIHKYVTIDGIERVERAKERGKGVIFITGHIGNWELISSAFIAAGHPGTVIGKRIKFGRYNELITDMRRAIGLGVVHTDEPPTALFRELRRNRTIGILADQDVKKFDGVFINFMGKRAYTPTAPVVFAERTGAALVPVVIVRDGQHHILHVEEPITLRNTGDRDADLAYNTLQWSNVLERYIRSYPSQWVWMHRRWRTTPEMIRDRAGV